MPSCITHQILAEEAKNEFPAEVKNAIVVYEDYFFLGSQGPDLFFFVKPLSQKEFNLGRYLHRRKVYETFRFLRGYLDTLDGAERLRVTAYCAGYICHYAADVAFHPFVYNYLERYGSRGMTHQQIETDWDEYFARTVRGRSAERWDFPFSAEKINADGTLFRLCAALAEEIGRLPIEEYTIRRCVKRYAKFIGFFHGKSRHYGFARAEKILHLKPRLSCGYPRAETDPAFLGGENFYELSGERGKNADELFTLAKNESARLCRLFFSDSITRKDFNNSYLTGTPVNGF